MAQPVPARLQIQFGPFAADLHSGELFKYGIRIKLQDRPFAILAMLLERPGETVSREDMRRRLWPDGTFVDFDNNISSAIGKLRSALSDSAATPRYIETVGRRGYRFIAEVKLVSGEAPSLPEAPAQVQELATPRVHSRGLWVTLGLAALLLVVGALSYLSWSRSRVSQPAETAKTMLAVLPFTNLTGDPSQDYFSDGFTEELITQLGRIDPAHLGVIGRTSVMSYKNRTERLDQIGRQLGVQYVLEGSVRRDSNRVRITAQLILVRDQTHLLAREYDRELSDVLSLQAEIAVEMADEIEIALGNNKRADAARLLSQTPQAYEAYDLYLKGRYFWNKRTRDGFRQANALFQQAVDRDPNYARAYAGLADSYALMSSYYEGPPGELMSKARAAALKALQIDDNLAEAHTSLALIAEDYDWDWEAAEKEFRRAIQLDPNYPTAHHWYAEFLAFRGRFDEALQESEHARRLDPLSVIIATDRAAILYYDREYGRAIEQLRGVLEMDPNLTRAQGILVSCYARTGRHDDALAVIDKYMAPGFPGWAWGHRAAVFALRGQPQRALEAATKAESTFHRLHEDPAPMLAVAYATMGRKDAANLWLDKAYQEHSSLMTSLQADPAFDLLRKDRHFQDLLRRVHLAQN